MGRVQLSTYQVIDEGSYLFKVESVEYKTEFGKMKITLSIPSGEKHIENYSLLQSNGDINQKAMSAFSFFAKTILNIDDDIEIDEQWLVGSHVKGKIVHDKVPKRDNPNEFLTFAHLKELEAVNEPKPNLPKNYLTYFDEPTSNDYFTEPLNESPKVEPKKDVSSFDLNDILG